MHMGDKNHDQRNAKSRFVLLSNRLDLSACLHVIDFVLFVRLKFLTSDDTGGHCPTCDISEEKNDHQQQDRK